MATELSQAEVLDFLCQAGGRAANAALLGHFKGFLRDPEAPPAELRRRRELFKGFVNSVATVKQQQGGPGAPKDVVLRKRYRELVGEEPRKATDDAQARTPERRRRREPPGEGGPPPPGMVAARGLGGRCCEALPWPPPPPCPRACPAEEPRARAVGQAMPRRDLLRAKEEAPPPPPTTNGLHLPVGEMGATLGGDSPRRQRIRAWVATHQAPASPESDPNAVDPEEEEDEVPRPARARCSPPPGAAAAAAESGGGGGSSSSSSNAWRRLPPPPPAAPRPRLPPTAPAVAVAAREPPPPVPVFRSIRCQLSLQDLEDFLEQESDGSSSSDGLDDGEATGVLRRLLRRSKRRSIKPTGGAWSGAEGTPGKEGAPQRNGATPEPHALLSRIASRAVPSWGKEAEKPSKGLAKQPKKGARLPPPSLDAAPPSPRPAPRQGPLATSSTPAVEQLDLDADGPPAPRSGLVPLEPREHTWLVKLATGSWMQAWALLLEDPHLAIHKDFISGYTVLHWLAKHGNAQVLLDVVAGAEKAGVAIDVNVKSGSGYTPLHLAAMHGHPLVMKALVQKLHCRVQIRDSSGKRPWQYLSSATSGEVWQLLGAPRGKTIFPARPIIRNSSPPAQKGKSPELARKISRKASLAAYLKHQHTKWKMANKYPPLHEREEYSD